MKPLRISHFVEQGVEYQYKDYPAFIVECDDGLRYFSSADRWEAITPKSLPALRNDVEAHDIVYRLLRSPVDEKTITNARGLFWNATITECDMDFSFVVKGDWMFCETTELRSIKSNFQSLLCSRWMFDGTGLQALDLDFPSLITADFMYAGAKKLQLLKGYYPNLKESDYIFFESSIKLSDKQMQAIINAGGQFDIQTPKFTGPSP